MDIIIIIIITMTWKRIRNANSLALYQTYYIGISKNGPQQCVLSSSMGNLYAHHSSKSNVL